MYFDVNTFRYGILFDANLFTLCLNDRKDELSFGCIWNWSNVLINLCVVDGGHGDGTGIVQSPSACNGTDSFVAVKLDSDEARSRCINSRSRSIKRIF